LQAGSQPFPVHNSAALEQLREQVRRQLTRSAEPGHLKRPGEEATL